MGAPGWLGKLSENFQAFVIQTLVGVPPLIYHEKFDGGVSPATDTFKMGPVRIGTSLNFPRADADPADGVFALQAGELGLQITGPPKTLRADGTIEPISIGGSVSPLPPGLEAIMLRATFAGLQGPHAQGDTFAAAVNVRSGGVDDVDANGRVGTTFRTVGVESFHGIPGSKPDPAYPVPTGPQPPLPKSVYDSVFPTVPGPAVPEFTLEILVDLATGKCKSVVYGPGYFAPGISPDAYRGVRYVIHPYLPAGVLSAAGFAVVIASSQKKDVAQLKVRDFQIYAALSQDYRSWRARGLFDIVRKRKLPLLFHGLSPH